MSVRAEMVGFVKEAAEPRPRVGGVRAAIRKASGVLGRPYGYTKRVWYDERESYTAEEYLETRRRIDEKRRREEEREKQRLRAQLAAIEAQSRDNVDALVEDARKLLGPLFDLLVAHGKIKVDGLETPKDGEA